MSQLLTIFGSDTAYKIQEFVDAPGIYYEKIGTLNLCTDIWTLAIRMDLTHVAHLESHVLQNLKGFQEKCKEIAGPDTHGGELIDNIIRLSKKVTESVGVVHDLVGGEHPRQRRGLIDGLGTVLKSITGNLDAADGERINAEIENVQKGQEALKEGMKKQIQVVETTMDLFNRSSHAAERNFNALYSMVRSVNEYFRNQTNALKNRQHFDESLALMDTYVEDFLREIKGIVELFVDVNSGKVSPAIITPEKLHQYLTNALPHLPRGHSFPLTITRSNMARLLRLATAKAYRKGQEVILLLEIPLVGQSDYSINYVYPMPRPSGNNTYYYIETSEEYVIIDRENRRYLRMIREDLDTCKVDEDRYFCSPKFPSMVIDKDAPCEVLLFVGEVAAEGGKCPKRAIKFAQTLIMSLQHEGKWIYVAPHDEIISIACQEMATQQRVLRGTGSLALQEKCAVSAKHFKLETTRRILQEIRDNSYIPAYNLTLTSEEAHITPQIADVCEGIALEHVVSSPRELNKLGTRLRSINSDLDSVRSNRGQFYHMIGQYSIGSIALVVLVGYIFYRWIRVKYTGSNNNNRVTSSEEQV